MKIIISFSFNNFSICSYIYNFFSSNSFLNFLKNVSKCSKTRAGTSLSICLRSSFCEFVNTIVGTWFIWNYFATSYTFSAFTLANTISSFGGVAISSKSLNFCIYSPEYWCQSAWNNNTITFPKLFKQSLLKSRFSFIYCISFYFLSQIKIIKKVNLYQNFLIF